MKLHEMDNQYFSPEGNIRLNTQAISSNRYFAINYAFRDG